MAHTVEFQSIAGTHGGYINEMELVVNSPSFSFLKKQLTMKNGKIAWKVKFLKKKLDYWKSLVAVSGDGAFFDQSVSFRDSSNRKIEEAHRKIPEIESELEELIPQLTEELFTEVDGALVIPPGLWYLCESIRNNAHLNEDLQEYYLECLRPYQKEALSELYKFKRAMIELATGLGKSKIIQSIALAAVKSGKRCMIIVPTEYLVGQMAEEMKTLHANTTAQGGGRLATLGWDVLVTTLQSAVGFADMPDVVCFDETHHIAAESWTKLAMSLSKATHVYGLTATAFRSDGLDVAIHSFAGPIVYSRDVRWGIENGWLNNFSAFVVKVHPKKNGRKICLPDTVMATTAYKALVPSLEVMSIAKDKLLKSLEKGRKVIVVFKTVEACKTFKKFCEDKINLSVASAQMGKKSKAPLARFQKNTERVLLVNSGLISEGVDIKDCDTMIQCCQNSSDVMTMQLLGRILRSDKNKRKSIIIDISVKGFLQYERSGSKRALIYQNIIGEQNVKIIEIE